MLNEIKGAPLNGGECGENQDCPVRGPKLVAADAHASRFGPFSANKMIESGVRGFSVCICVHNSCRFLNVLTCCGILKYSLGKAYVCVAYKGLTDAHIESV